MDKRGKWILWVSIALVIILIGIMFFYFALWKPNYGAKYSGVVLPNPASGLSDEEAVAAFNESFVYYLLVSIKAYDLHSIPITGDKPKIEVYVGDVLYNAVVDKGNIVVGKGALEDKDAVIRTTTLEAVNMVRNKNYVKDSFSSGKSTMELVASKSTLFGKGYLGLYTEITGKSVTGNVFKIYTS